MWNNRHAATRIPAPLLLSLIIALPGSTTPAFGQAGLRPRIERQLNRGEGPEDQPRSSTAAPPSDVAEEDLKQIREAKTAEQLVELGKTFLTAGNKPAAEKAIEAAVLKKAELLEDGQKQAPRSWNDLWFSHRAKIREKRLPAKDAAGRVKLAVWLHEGGLPAQARAMLATALAIDKKLPEAVELAEKWNVAISGPVQFDLTYGLKEPLLVESIQDEGQAVSPRKGRKFLILPFTYNAAGARLLLSKGSVKVTSDDGKPCAVLGIALLDRSDAGGFGAATDPMASRGKVPDVKMPAGSEPLWEQLLIEPAKKDQPQELAASNLAHPIVRPAPGQRGAPPPPAPVGGGALHGRLTRPITGHAAFIVEVPETFQSVECSFNKGETSVTLDAELLAVLGKPIDHAQPAERDRMARGLAAQASPKSAAVACAVVRKLNLIRLGGAQVQGQSPGAEPGRTAKTSPTVMTVVKVLLDSLGHESAAVRRAAFDALLTDPPQEIIDLIATHKDEPLLGNLAVEIEAYFADLDEAAAAAEANSGQPTPAAGRGFGATGADLAPLPGSAGVVTLMVGCLRCSAAPVRLQTLDVVLAHPFQGTVEALSSAGDAAVDQLLRRLPNVEDAALKGAIFRVLLKRSDKKMLGAVLAAFKGTRIAIARDDDPLLEVAMGQHPAEVQRSLLELLAGADLSEVANSDRLKRLIEALSTSDAKSPPAVRAALLKLAQEQMKGGYQAPVKRASQQGNYAGANAVGFDTLLASVAAGPNTDPQMATAAAAVLLNAGRVQILHERLQRLQPPATMDERIQSLVQNLARDKSLAERESLPIFLAMQLTSQNPKTLALALSALRNVQSSVGAKHRWRVNLAIKQVVDTRQLVTLSVNGDENISRQATSLVRELSGMTPTEGSEFEGLPDETARQERVQTLEQARPEKAVGPFACMVYLDVRPISAPNDPGRRMSQAERSSVPLPVPTSSPASFQRPAQGGGGIRVIFSASQIGPPASHQGGQSSPGIVPIDASPLLRAALESPEAKKEGLADKVNLLPLRTEQPCDLKYELLGTWSGELTVQGGAEGSSGEHSLEVVGAKIFLEPVTQ